ncbi:MULTISPECIES: DeoR/GlpR family DNA-binding transcription regulator [Microbacterium]|uniref:DeoR/GlpR family DNA-binding transcription regulator n=1 Tax=Microbacterium TaxID=33882 RepID=UPI001E56B49E|nr:DeoR/GlpR family DNA-binding transcription regulator [Microbacterium nymphoidis]MCD2499433.1 DeoR/GlpR family DNA-binding transcription regulator [Microbacterium nymphoidis]
MNRDQRLSAILDLLGEAGRIEVEDIVERLAVSPATARRDLDALAEQQLLNRTRGGAVAHSVAYDLPLRYKNQRHVDSKAAIAGRASEITPRGAVIGLCGGTTTTAIADALMSRADLQDPSPEPGLTVVTNAINIAMHLAARDQIKTVITGGVLHARSYEVVGSYADSVLGAMNLDIAFIGANGLDAAVGASASDEREAAVNRLMAQRAERAVLVVDSSKIGTRSFAAIGGAELFDTVITDDAVSPEQLEALRTAGYQVIVAEAGNS